MCVLVRFNACGFSCRGPGYFSQIIIFTVYAVKVGEGLMNGEK